MLPPGQCWGEHAGAAGVAGAARAGHSVAEGVGRNHHFCSPPEYFPMGSSGGQNGKTMLHHKPGCHRTVSALR